MRQLLRRLRRPPGTGRAWPRPDLACLLVCLFAVAWAASTLFTGYGALAVLAGAVLAAAAVVTVTSRRTRRFDVLAAVSVAGFAGYSLVTLFGPLSTHGPFGARAFVPALRAGWSALLTTGVPADPEAVLLVTPVLLVWLATAAAVALAVTTGAALPALVPVLAGFVAALALTASHRGGTLPAAVLLGLSGLGFVLVRAEPPVSGDGAAAPGDGAAAPSGVVRTGGGGGLSGRLLLGLPVVVVAVGLGAVVAIVMPSRAPADPRTLHDQSVSFSRELNPLVEVRGQLTATPPRRLGTVRLASSTGRLPVDRVTTALLGDFDGARWRNGNTFVRAGGVPPEGELAPVEPAVTVRADISFDTLASPLLPGVGWPTRLAGAGLAVDSETGALLATGPPADGYRYQLTAAVPAPDQPRLDAAVPGSGPEFARYLGVPAGLPADLVAVATTATAGARTPYAQLTALERYLRDAARFPYDLNGRPGQSYGSLTRMLTSPDQQEQRGYAEQHAAAFALLARVKGFPSRIAVGYLLAPGGDGGQGVFEISQSRAHAWPEVYLDGIGWVPFEPTDTSDLDRQSPVDAASAEGDGAAPPEPDPAVDEAPLPKVEPIPLLHAPPSGGGGAIRSATLWLLIVLAAVLVAVPPLLVAEKWRRRRRRRGGGTPEARIAGAWREARDRLWDWGVPPDRSRTATDVVEDARALGAPAAEVVERLGVLITAAAYAHPGSVGPADAAHAWALVDDLRRRLGEGRPLTRRLRAAVNPRPLLGRRFPLPPPHPRSRSRAGVPAAFTGKGA
ncbi:transglutaminaseTgpA domain-containing protein [Parafrankia elaeagni]|uniref:transglutaminaseTgpA domain-containing protein n=1 Tax=Parafrankia elaeagni TaxID=222534 RepID=UPI000A001427|nr:transglutaminaseTgpA domain-containing protein [Parafrankia elaeagni]